jgi:Arm DNA-binding domain
MPSGWTRKRGSTWTWYIEDVPDPRTGRPRQVSKGGFRTRKEARDALLPEFRSSRACEGAVS